MSIHLYKHNEDAYRAVETMLEEKQMAAVIHPTGTGKSMIAFKLVEQHPHKHFLWLSPSEYIYKTQLENIDTQFSNIKYMSYSRLMKHEDSIDTLHPDYIILDEFHRCGAAEWGKSVRKLLEAYPKARRLGLSATNIRYLDNQRNMAEELFEGNIASEMTLGEAIVREILPEPKYVIAMYSYKKELEQLKKRIEGLSNPGLISENEKLLEQLKRALEQADGLTEVFARQMTKPDGKYIVFCSGREHMDEMKAQAGDWFSKVDKKPHIYTAYYNDASTSKAFGAYGGYETFVYKLTEYHQNNPNIKYHVACKANGDGYMDETKLDNVKRISDTEFEFHNARCFKIHIPQIGAAQAIYYDVAALRECCKYIKKNNIEKPIVYIMACRIGPFAKHFYKEIHKLGGKVYLNPDGHEWMRAKWSKPIRKYWKASEQMMVKYCDLAICDSVNIEKYIHEQYDGKGINGKNPNTTFIAYGADLTPSKLSDDDEKLVNWYKEKGLSKKNYYLVVGRFVPENSFEIMIREFMKSKSKKDFALITNVNDKFLNELENKLHFRRDPRIKFVGTVYDQELLKKIRENAYAYFHGHTVGGTNPSLIEALGSTDLNLLVDIGFNREVAEDCALYWSKELGELAKLINQVEVLKKCQIDEIGTKAKARVLSKYTWDEICSKYMKVFFH